MKHNTFEANKCYGDIKTQHNKVNANRMYYYYLKEPFHKYFCLGTEM